MIRSLHLTDIAALLLFLGKPLINEARTRDRLSDKGEGLLAVVPLLKGCLTPRDKRHSLVYVHRGLIRGLVSVRSRSGPSAWEIERLLLAPGREEVCLDLLERLGFAGDKLGAEWLFLRLDSSSPLVDMARQAGFCHYLIEFLYCLGEARQSHPSASSLVLRPKLSADEYGLFRLYSVAVPIQVRSVEGMTFQEWRQSRDRDTTRELVFEEGGEISAWLRIMLDRMAGQFDMVTGLEATELGQLVNYSLVVLNGRCPIYCLVPEFQQRLRSLLEEQGFHQVAEYSCLSKQLVARVHGPELVPLRA